MYSTPHNPSSQGCVLLLFVVSLDGGFLGFFLLFASVLYTYILCCHGNDGFNTFVYTHTSAKFNIAYNV